MEIFYNDIQPKRTGKKRLQTDLESNQNKIKTLNKKFDVEMFHTKIRGEKAFAAEQKIREFKEILLRSKRFEKIKKIEQSQVSWLKMLQKIWTKQFLLNMELHLKKDASGKFFKSSTDNIPFFNRNRIFTIYKKVELNNNSYLYWLEENECEVRGRFLRQVLFALNNQFLRWDQVLPILRK